MNLYKDDLPSDVAFKGSVAVDTETMGLVTKRDRLCLVQLCSEDGDVHIVQISRQNQHQQQNQQDQQSHQSKNLKKLLTDKSVVKIFHFARFDISILNYTFGIKVNPIYCTKIASKLVRTYTDKHGLKNLCKEILNLDISKQEQSSDWGRENLSQEQLTYAANDVLHLHKLKHYLDEMLTREGKFPLAQKCFEALHLISELEISDIAPHELFAH